jgi:uncharacterized membrane protein
MAIILALLCASAYGTGDFFGGLATRRVGSAFAVVFASQLVSLVFVVAIAPLFGGNPHAADMAWAAAGGVAGAVGLVSFYRGLAIGPMSITAPVSAVIAAVVPVLVGIVSGERPGARALVGIPIAIIAIVLFSSSPATDTHHVRPTVASLVYAAVAGVGFGTFFVFLAQVRREAELFPLLASRAASISGPRRRPRVGPKPDHPARTGCCRSGRRVRHRGERLVPLGQRARPAQRRERSGLPVPCGNGDPGTWSCTSGSLDATRSRRWSPRWQSC